jgi:hypothetical protein
MVMLAGHVIEGPVLSVTMMVWTHWLVLPQPSDAVQVLVIVCNNGQTPPTTTSLNVTTGLAAQLSVAVAVPVTAGNVL